MKQKYNYRFRYLHDNNLSGYTLVTDTRSSFEELRKYIFRDPSSLHSSEESNTTTAYPHFEIEFFNELDFRQWQDGDITHNELMESATIVSYDAEPDESGLPNFEEPNIDYYGYIIDVDREEECLAIAKWLMQTISHKDLPENLTEQ